MRAGDLTAGLSAFFALGALLAAHALLETARDALFLASLPAARLPWVYLAIAVFGLVVANFGGRGRISGTHLATTQLFAAVVTAAFWVAAASPEPWFYYAFYIWSGMFATVATVQFWVFVGDHYTVSEAKRMFGFVGTGGILGAILGSVAARGLAEIMPTRHLVLAAALVMAATVPLPLIMRRALRGRRVSPTDVRRIPFVDAVKQLVTHGYSRRLALLVFVSTVAFTTVDFVFKSAVAGTVEAAELGSFFASFYVVLNVASLLAQLILVPLLLRRLGLGAALALLPALLLGGALGVAVGWGLVAALVMKGADGSLRHSVHRTATEVLYLPMSSSLRASVKLVIDVLAQRGGQAVASVAILAALSLASPTLLEIAVAVAVVVALWLVIVVDLRPRYLDLFRATLDESVASHIHFPELDMASLESLISKLNSLDDDEVIAAMDVLALQGKTHLLPDLILFHPSRKVVLDAFHRFLRERRTSFLPVAERLLDSSDPEIRAAALLAHDIMASEPQLLRRGIDDPDPGVRATARVAMVARGQLEPEVALETLRAELAENGDGARISFVRALRRRPAPALIEFLVELAADASPVVQRHIAGAAGELLDHRLIAPLIAMLPERSAREAARMALVAMGGEAARALERALDDPATTWRIREHIPRTISRFAPAIAAPLLMARLTGGEVDEVVRYKCLRGIGRLVANNPELEIDRDRVTELLRGEVAAAIRLLRWRVAAALEAEGHRFAADPVHQLLIKLLSDKERHALERAFRLVGLLEPRENLEAIYRSLSSEDRRVHASGRELLSSLLDRELRAPLMSLTDDVSDAERLAGVSGGRDHRPSSYAALLVELAGHGDASLQCTAIRLAGVTGAPLEPILTALGDDPDRAVAEALSLRAGAPRAREGIQ